MYEQASTETQNEILKEFNTSLNGLNKFEIKNRLNKYGKNKIEIEKGNAIRIFIKQFSSPLIILLIIAALISLFIGQKMDSILIISIVIAGGILSFLQEYRANKAFEKLQKMVKQIVTVKRNSEVIKINSEDLVPGDIILLKPGDVAPADIRLIDGNLIVNQSIITGESKGIKKISKKISKPSNIFDMRNIIFSGSWITYGEAIGIIISTGKNTYIGKLKKKVKEEKKESKFYFQIKEISKLIGYLVIAITTLVFFADIFIYGINKILILFLFVIAIAIGIVPEALPAVITIALANGARKLSKKDVIIKRLSAMEDLGNIDILCVDKTGTITEGKEIIVNFVGNKKFAKMCAYGNSSLDQKIRRKFKQDNVKVVKIVPFDPFRKIGSVIVEKGNKRYLISKGAPDFIEKKCSKTIEWKKYTTKYRVIAVAYKEIKNKNRYGTIDENNLKMAGLFLLEDPIKKTVKGAFELAKKLNVKIKILTGDDPSITKVKLNEIGINESVWIGDIKKEIDTNVEKYDIFARLTPIGKLKIVEELKKNGHSVGFLGDGVNDSAALRISDVGITVNNANDIAKESSDIILTKKSLYSILEGIKEGRKIFSNIIKYLRYTFVGNFGDLYSVSLLSVILGFLPLLPFQILLANLLTDLPMVSVSSDNVDSNELKKPNKWNPKFILLQSGLLGGIDSTFDFIFIGFLFWVLKSSINSIRTCWFLEIIFTEILVIFSLRTTKPFFKSKPSKSLLIISILTIISTFPFLLLPGFTRIGLISIFLIFIYSIIYMLVTDIVKLIIIKKT